MKSFSERRIRAAGFDVLEDEPLVPGHQLRRMPNVILTPHVGGAGIEIAGQQVEGTLSNIARFLSGRAPRRLVNSEVLKQGKARAQELIAR